MEFHLILLYSKTTYFDSLLTNRAMDYHFKGDRTAREVFELRQLLSKLFESKLSNHIVFNGFIETADRFYIFVKRGKNLSIAKNNFLKSLNEHIDNKKYLIEDGREVKFYTLNELKESKLDIELITVQRKKYPLVPSISFLIACLLSCL